MEMTLEGVGVRDLKANLSRYLRQVQSGTVVAVTDRGRTIATIQPVTERPSLRWAQQLVAEGGATWSGGKPLGASVPARPRGGRKTAAEMISEDRR